MYSLFVAAIIFASVFIAFLVALRIRSLLPQHHLQSDSKETVNLAMGMIATMAALVLGLLVASAKGSFDNQRAQVSTMAAKIAFVDGLLAMYGPESTAARKELHDAAETMTGRLWPETSKRTSQLIPQSASGEVVYRAISKLSPKDDDQKALRDQALTSIYDIFQTRWLLFEQSDSSVSTPLLVVVVCWISILFFSFGLFSPSNRTVILAMMVGALSVSGAFYLVLELDHPFAGLMRISSESMVRTLNHLSK